MSLTVALKAADGLVLAADSRVTEGYTLEGPRIQDNSVKFICLDRHWGIQTYGNSNIGSAGIGALRDRVTADASLGGTLSALAGASREVFLQASEKWSGEHPSIPRSDKDVGFVLAGYGNDADGPVIVNFQSPDFRGEIVQQGCLLAGQWHIARFFLVRLYLRDTAVAGMKDLAVLLLGATMKSEKTVGGAIRLAEITPSGGFRWSTEEETDEIRGRCEVLERRFRERLRDAISLAAGRPAEEGRHGGGS